MRAVPLWQVSVVAGAAYESQVGDCLSGTFKEAVSVHTDLERGVVRASVYRESRPGRESLSRLEAAIEGLPGIKQALPPRIEVKLLRPRDWVNAWKRHFKPMTIGGRLLIKPSWSRRRPLSIQRTVVLDPGLSFGTGQHPTTRFCLERIVALRPGARGKSLLDVGTGSGILAIAARKLGFHPVDAIDHDPTAVRVAVANARRNRIQVRVFKGDVARLRPKGTSGYDVVCANLTSDLLIRHANRIVAQVQPDGCLILAGILGVEFEQVRLAYEEAGWCMTRTRAKWEWQSGAFVAI